MAILLIRNRIMPQSRNLLIRRSVTYKNFFTRLITTLLLLPLVLVVTYEGGLWFISFVSLTIGIAIFEWSRLCGEKSLIINICYSLIGPIISVIYFYWGFEIALVSIIIFALICGFTNSRLFYSRLWLSFGICYLCLPMICIIKLRMNNFFGLEYVLFLFIMVWMTDIGAYFVGSLFGGPKLVPSISPQKTWSGAFGGLLFSLVSAIILYNILENKTSQTLLFLAVILSIVAQIGDLFESWVKRRFNKKDSGSIIPGHGGILDRIDGLLTSAPIMLLITLLLRDIAFL